MHLKVVFDKTVNTLIYLMYKQENTLLCVSVQIKVQMRKSFATPLLRRIHFWTAKTLVP